MRPDREQYESGKSTYFVSTQTAGRRALFRNESWAKLLTTVLHHYRETGYTLHSYVIMPEHLHLLITPVESVEKSVQLIKGGFSFRLKRELSWAHDVWQPGFTDHRIRDEEGWDHHLKYIQLNPVKANLVEDSALYPYMDFPNKDFPRGLKPIPTVVD